MDDPILLVFLLLATGIYFHRIHQRPHRPQRPPPLFLRQALLKSFAKKVVLAFVVPDFSGGFFPRGISWPAGIIVDR